MREIKFNSISLFQIGIKDCQKGRYVAGAECCIELLDKLKPTFLILTSDMSYLAYS